MIIYEEKFEKIKDLIKKSKAPIIFCEAEEELTRTVLEKLAINILLIELEDRKDFSKQRDSGFNHVLADICKKKKIQIGINLDELIDSERKSKIIARLSQNIELCKKDKVQMQFIQIKNKRSLHEIKAIGSALNMPTWMTSKLELIKE